jgi:hypothetical protein
MTILRVKVYLCDQCEQPTVKLFRIEDEAVCSDCYDDYLDRGEYAYEAYREAEVTGN